MYALNVRPLLFSSYYRAVSKKIVKRSERSTKQVSLRARVRSFASSFLSLFHSCPHAPTLVAVCETSSNLPPGKCYVVRGGVALVGWFVVACQSIRVKTFCVGARINVRLRACFARSASLPMEAWRYPCYTVTDLQLYEAVIPPVGVAVGENTITYSDQGYGNTLMAGTSVLQHIVPHHTFKRAFASCVSNV